MEGVVLAAAKKKGLTLSPAGKTPSCERVAERTAMAAASFLERSPARAKQRELELQEKREQQLKDVTSPDLPALSPAERKRNEAAATLGRRKLEELNAKRGKEKEEEKAAAEAAELAAKAKADAEKRQHEARTRHLAEQWRGAAAEAPQGPQQAKSQRREQEEHEKQEREEQDVARRAAFLQEQIRVSEALVGERRRGLAEGGGVEGLGRNKVQAAQAEREGRSQRLAADSFL